MEVERYKVYSKNGCPYCTKIVKVLELAELPYTVYKMGRDFTREEYFYHFGQDATFPKVKLGDKILGGCMETVKYLKESNLV